MDWIHQIFHKSPEIALFLSLAAGYFIGQINSVAWAGRCLRR
jgi:hypothetical protein